MSRVKGRSGSSLGVSRKHCGVPSLRGAAGQGGEGKRGGGLGVSGEARRRAVPQAGGKRRGARPPARPPAPAAHLQAASTSCMNALRSLTASMPCAWLCGRAQVGARRQGARSSGAAARWGRRRRVATPRGCRPAASRLAARRAPHLVDLVHHAEGGHRHVLRYRRRCAAHASGHLSRRSEAGRQAGRVGRRRGPRMQAAAPVGSRPLPPAAASIRLAGAATARPPAAHSSRAWWTRCAPSNLTSRTPSTPLPPPTHLQRDEVEDGGHAALAAALPAGVQRLQLLGVPELDAAGGRASKQGCQVSVHAQAIR